MKKNNKVLIIIMAIIIVVLLAVILLNVVKNNDTSNINVNSNKEKTKQKSNNNEEKNSKQISEVEANDILKEKVLNYVNITSPQTYCGDNSFSVDNELNNSLGMDATIIYWNQSKQFSTYEEMKRFVLNNVSEEIYSKTKVADKTLYKEKDGKLYCGQVGAGVVGEDDRKYQVTSYDSNKIIGIITNIYSQESVDIGLVDSLEKKYNVKIGKSKDSTMYWSLVQALENGIGIHHGKFPKYVQNEVLRLFNNGDFDYLFCTSTIIEGVNTNAKNVVIINNSVGNTTMTAFALKNIKGRAGRYYHHAMGRVFYTDSKQRQIENADDMQLNFQTYDTHPILNADIDNASLDDLAEENRNIKVEREEKFNRNLLPDNVFIKNRLYPRDVQEKYLNYVMQTNVFRKFVGLIGNSSNIRYFLTNKVINVILETFEVTQILDTNKAKVYYSVVSTYSQNGTIGILQYHIGKLQENNSMFKEKIDSAYIKAFEQIRNIVEYEIPKLLCLFESLFQQAGKLLGYNMDDFNLSSVIRFFELGITTELGLFLVEFGFPTDTIRALENKYPSIGKMGALEAATFLSNNQRAMYSVMDAYEQELFKRAMQVLVKRG